jgi:hypothetical protein
MHLLNETVALGSARVHLVALQDDLLKLTVRLEDLLKILLRDTEVNVSDIETMEGSAVGARGGATFGWSSCAVLLSLSELGDDRYAFKLLAGQLESLWNRVLILELNVADTKNGVSAAKHMAQVKTHPFERPVTRSFTI